MSDNITDQTTPDAAEASADEYTADTDVVERQEENVASDEQSAPEGKSPTLEDWKRHARTWESRSKQHKADLEVATAELEKLRTAPAAPSSEQDAVAAAARYKTALAHGMDVETADAVLTGADAETIEAQAAAFNAAVAAAVEKKTDQNMAERQVTPVPANPLQGNPGTPKPDPQAMFERLSRL